jgi:hypothetical protein
MPGVGKLAVILKQAFVNESVRFLQVQVVQSIKALIDNAFMW